MASPSRYKLERYDRTLDACIFGDAVGFTQAIRHCGLVNISGTEIASYVAVHDRQIAAWTVGQDLPAHGVRKIVGQWLKGLTHQRFQDILSENVDN